MSVSYQSELVTRFAPSPSGLLHLGHAYAALVAFDVSQSQKGRFLLRIEDIDHSRCRPEFIRQIETDLAWLEINWEKPVLIQSSRFDAYGEALQELAGHRILYPCFCTRKQIRDEIARSGAAPHGPDGLIYPGTCRTLSEAERADRQSSGMSYVLRLNVEEALRLVGPLSWTDEKAGEIAANPTVFGDVVLARKDTPTSYHLSVVVDDAFQGVTLVTRGEDLFQATHIHRLLQALLEYETPRYLHHRLIVDPDGKKFSKRDHGSTLKALRENGTSASDVRRMVGLTQTE